MTRKEFEASEAVEIEEAIRRTNEECDAEVTERVTLPSRFKLVDVDSLTMEQAIALPKGHPARFLRLYGTRTGRWSCAAPTAITLAEARLWRWRVFHPFAADLMACAETNS